MSKLFLNPGVSKAYVDALLQGLDIKQSVRAATTGPITLSGAQTIDGVSVIAGDRVLVKDQASGATNGIYVCAAGAWARATDANTSAKVTTGMYCWVAEGTVNGDNGYVLTTNDAIVLGTTALVFTQFNGAGMITAGNNITKSGNTISTATTLLEGDGTALLPSYSFTSDPDTGLYRVSANELGFVAGGAERASITTTGLKLNSSGGAATPYLYFNGDTNTGIYRVAADDFGIAAGGVLSTGFNATGHYLPSTATTGIQLYNTADQTTNYERATQYWSSNTWYLGFEKGGTGTARDVELFNSSGTIGTGVRTSVLLSRGSSRIQFLGNRQADSTTGVTTVSIVNAVSGNTATSGTGVTLSVTPTYNQASGTAANTDLLINRTETAVGSGAQLLIDAQVAGTSKFAVNNAGKVTLATHTTSAGGIGFGTDTSFYRDAAGTLAVGSTGTNSYVSYYDSGGLKGITGTVLGDLYLTTQTAKSIFLRTNATTALTLDSSQNATFGGNVLASSGSLLGWNGGASRMASPSDGVITLRNSGNTDFTRLQFGGTTASFPALKRSTTNLQVRLADDSGFAGIGASLFSPTPGVTWSAGSGSPEGVLTASVGSMYSRTDGGAGTSLYVKESGTGNTGWVAK